MLSAKSVFVSMAVLGLSLSFHPTPASAGVFSKLVSNPFIFCSAPKPCKQCFPFRKIWERICKDQKGSSRFEDPDRSPFRGTAIQMRQEIDRLTQLLDSQNAISTAAGLYLEQCVALNGPVQDGFCADEQEDYNGAQLASNATLDEIGRLETAIGAVAAPAPPGTPAPPAAPHPPMTREEAIAAIAILTPIWREHVAMAKAAYKVVEDCVALKGRVQDGFCLDERDLFIIAAEPGKRSYAELERLQLLAK